VSPRSAVTSGDAAQASVDAVTNSAEGYLYQIYRNVGQRW
jgi:hypothetical protein